MIKCSDCGYSVEGVQEFICRCGKHVTSNEPSFTGKARNFLKASLKHAQNRFRQVTAEKRNQRLEICKACDLFNGNVCTHAKCGCGIKSRAGFIDKLGWESESCPEKKW